MIELRRGDEVTRSWPDDQLIVALEAFWSALLEEGALYNRWYRAQLSLPHQGDLEVPRDEMKLTGLAVRRSEPGFTRSLAELHAQHLDGPFPLELAREIDPHPPREVRQVIEVLRKALGIEVRLRHYGDRAENFRIPEHEPFTLVERHGAFANGAGTMTSYSVWQLDLRQPVRLQIVVEEEFEYGPSSWSTTLRALEGTALEPLVDAFEERELSLRTQFVKAL